MIEPSKLTPRQLEVLELVAHGLSLEEMGRKLFLSPGTVRSHIELARQRLGATNRAHAVYIAIQRGELRVDYYET